MMQNRCTTAPLQQTFYNSHYRSGNDKDKREGKRTKKMGETENMRKTNQEQARSLNGRDGEIKKHHGALSVLNVNGLKSSKCDSADETNMTQCEM